jgi:hypothetical protein
MASVDSNGAQPAPKCTEGASRELNFQEEVAVLQEMTVNQLRQRYVDVFGEPTFSRNKRHLIRKIAWRIQALEQGGLSERARRRAEELANDADVRVSAPNSLRVAISTGGTTVASVRDSRLPAVGQAIIRKYKNRVVCVIVGTDGFEYGGERYRSLSAVAKAITGSHCNGFRFFGLEGKK